MSKKHKTKTEEETPTDEQTEVVSESHAAGVVDAIEKNRVLVISSAVVLLAILAFVLVGKQLGQQKHLNAGMAFTKAATSRNVESLDKVVADYPGSISAGNAILSKADVQIDQGKPKDAISTLETMVGSYMTHPRYAQVFYMLGNIYHKSGDKEKARENYEKVIEVQQDGELTPITRIRLGDLAFAGGDLEKAEQLYEESYTIHPGNPFVPTAENRIAQLKVGSPSEIDRPKPPEPKKKEEEKPAPNAVKKADPAAKKPETAKKGKSEKGKPKKGDSDEVSAEVEVIEVE
jgi:predicted negative regulator of RcsB-dependent stress response